MSERLDRARQMYAQSQVNDRVLPSISDLMEAFADSECAALESELARLRKVLTTITSHPHWDEKLFPGVMDEFAERHKFLSPFETLRDDFDRLKLKNDALASQLASAKAALEQSMTALDVWLNISTPEFCSDQRSQEARERVLEVGTFAYIADVQKQNRKALAEIHDAGEAL